MELKLLFLTKSLLKFTSFNRTFMELKYLSSKHMSVRKVKF